MHIFLISAGEIELLTNQSEILKANDSTNWQDQALVIADSATSALLLTDMYQCNLVQPSNVSTHHGTIKALSVANITF